MGYQNAKVKELAAAVEESRRRRAGAVAEFARLATQAKLDADKRAGQLEQEWVKASTRQQQQTLTAPVAGTVQQLAINTIGGVVTPAQALMVIAPKDYSAEVEAILENSSAQHYSSTPTRASRYRQPGLKLPLPPGAGGGEGIGQPETPECASRPTRQ